MKKLLYILGSLLVLATACQKAETESKEPAISVEKSSIYFGPDGGYGSITVNSSGAISVKSNKEWCSAEILTNRNVFLTVQPANSLNSRYATVTVSCGTEETKLVVEQTGVIVKEFNPATSLNFDSKGGEIIYPFESDSKLTVKSDADWVVTTVNEDGLTIFVNGYTGDRKAKVYWDVQGAMSGEIAICQDGAWNNLGKCEYTDGFLVGIFDIDAKTYELDIQESSSVPGLFRLINPYGEAYPYNEPGDYDTTKDHYMIVHAEDSDAVYIETFDSGCDWSYGSMIMASKEFGKYEDKVITFPKNGLQLTLPKYSSKPFDTNSNGTFKIDLSMVK